MGPVPESIRDFAGDQAQIRRRLWAGLAICTVAVLCTMGFAIDSMLAPLSGEVIGATPAAIILGASIVLLGVVIGGFGLLIKRLNATRTISEDFAAARRGLVSARDQLDAIRRRQAFKSEPR